jgi:hypothetical protein
MLWDLLRNDDLIDCLHILLQNFNECQNRIELRQRDEMEETQNASSLKNEAKGMDVHLGVEGLNCNGHGEKIDK